MPIVVEAKSLADYQKWVAAERAKMPKPEVVQVTAAAPAAAAAPAGAPAAPAKAADGKTTYDTVCMACHTTGAAGAPKLGDKAAWAPRLAQGKDAMYAAALKGKGAMPPKGGNTAISDDAVKAAVDYLTASAK
jgi:cytochrome c5